MHEPAPSSRHSFWIGLAATAALLLGLAALIAQWRPVGTARAPAPPDTSEAVIDAALEQIPATVDSSEIKNRWMDEVKNVDYSALAPPQREIFVRFANAERCTCGCGFTLAACRTFDPSCPVSGPILEKLRDSVRAGWIRSAAGIRDRPRDPHDAATPAGRSSGS